MKARKIKRSRPTRDLAVTKSLEYGPLGVVNKASGYRAAETARTSGRSMATGGSGDYHLRYDLATLRQQSQEFDRNNGIYHGILNRALDCILGTGLRLQANSKDKEFNRDAEEMWREYWTDGTPEIRGMDDGQTVERLILRSVWSEGDTGVLLLDQEGFDGKIQIIEAERIDARRKRDEDKHRIENGVVLDAYDRPIGFLVCDYNDRGNLNVSDPRLFSAEDMLFIAHRQRISQTRGVPVMASNFAMIHRINDVVDSEAFSWQILSRMAVAITRNNAASIMQSQSDEDSSTEDGDLARRVTDLDSVVLFNGEPGEEIKGIDRNIPGSSFPESIRMFIRLAGLPVGLPLELMLLDWSKTNYSSARAAIKQAERMFHHWQRVMKTQAMRPIYLRRLEWWVKSEKLKAPEDYSSHLWIAPRYPFVDPQKEELGRALRYENAVTTPSQEAMSEGHDYDDLLRRQEEDLKKECEMVQRLNALYPEANIQLSDVSGLVRAQRHYTETLKLEDSTDEQESS